MIARIIMLGALLLSAFIFLAVAALGTGEMLRTLYVLLRAAYP